MRSKALNLHVATGLTVSKIYIHGNGVRLSNTMQFQDVR